MRLRISLVVPGLPFGPETLEAQSLGGSESAGAYMARSLAERDHQVYVFCNRDKAEVGSRGEFYFPLNDAQNFISGNPHDICIAQRIPAFFARPTAARLNILWQHDLAMSRDMGSFRGVLWNVDKIAVLSEFMRDQYQTVFGLDDQFMWKTRNGVDIDLIQSIPTRGERNEKLLVYASRPERGLDVLLRDIMPKLPDHQLAITTYDNQVEHMASFYQECRNLAAALGDRVKFLKPLSKPKLYDLYKHAGALVYPTPSPVCPRFREISCITAMEAMACGLPMVTSALGALPETLGPDAGVLVEGDPTQVQESVRGTALDQYVTAFVAGVEKATSDNWSESMSVAGVRAASGLSWDSLAKEWEEKFITSIEEMNDSPDRLMRHFIRRSDIVAAKEVAKRHPNEVDQNKVAWMDREFAFAFGTREDFRAHYAKIGETHTDVYEGAKQENRLDFLKQTLQQRKDIERVVDFGCGLGIYAIELSNACPWLTVQGIDVDAKTIEMALEYRDKYAEHPENVHFTQGTEMTDVSEFDPDLIIAFEVLEHVADPAQFLRHIETSVKEGTEITLTVPYGPWEHMSYATYPHRCHLWEFELNDLRDMLHGRSEVTVQCMVAGASNLTGDALGWHFVTYKKDQKIPIAEIDMDRKLSFQRPHETVTALYMAGGPKVDDTFRWSMNSVRPYVDEIIVADCGLDEATRREMIERFDCRMIESQNPNDVGFETPRNHGLEAVTTDWALWIDTDEKLVGEQCLIKYLRRNCYPGYSIRQHHFSVDGGFAPDMPVRLIRKNRYDGETIRFYGMIHEHPEVELNKGPGHVLILPDMNIAHVGYLDEATRRQRFVRNHPMLHRDQEAYPDRVLQKLFIIRDEQLLMDHEIAASGGARTPSIIAHAERIKELYREHFLGKTTYQNVDGLQYYSRALEVLGEGVEVDFSFGAVRDGIGERMNGPTQARFSTEEEAKIEIGHRLSQKIGPLISEHW